MKLEQILFNSGDLFLPKPLKAFLETYMIGNDTSIFYVTWWTFIHLVSGVVTGFLLYKYGYTQNYYLYGFLIHSVWELWQIIGKNTPYWTLRGQVDVLVDTAAYMIGMVLFSFVQ